MQKKEEEKNSVCLAHLLHVFIHEIPSIGLTSVKNPWWCVFFSLLDLYFFHTCPTAIQQKSHFASIFFCVCVRLLILFACDVLSVFVHSSQYNHKNSHEPKDNFPHFGRLFFSSSWILFYFFLNSALLVARSQ